MKKESPLFSGCLSPLFVLQDNNIDFWRKFVAEYFAPNLCVSLYASGRQTTGVFPQVWSAKKDVF